MEMCKPITTPIDTNSNLSLMTGDLVDNPSLYRSLAGPLQYITFTKPNISYAVQQVFLFMHSPRVVTLMLSNTLFDVFKVLLSFISIYIYHGPLGLLLTRMLIRRLL